MPGRTTLPWRERLAIVIEANPAPSRRGNHGGSREVGHGRDEGRDVRLVVEWDHVWGRVVELRVGVLVSHVC